MTTERIRCRRCRMATGTIYLDGKNHQTKTPVCQHCYEDLVRSNEKTGRHNPGYVGPGRDPDHTHLSFDQLDAMEWFAQQLDDNADTKGDA